MKDGSTRRVKRLISFRESEREKAGGEVGASKSRRDRATSKLENARQIHTDELDKVVNQMGKPFMAEDVHLAIICANEAELDVEDKVEELGRAERELDEKTRLLIAAHNRVKQMGALLKILEERREKEARIKEQREIDDLVTTRETSR
ncbi:MAG: hypothetical protein GY854_15605 [Deltaproteobacteria bacterium]|nr:hypothetical protein [Deltaproteobacteria bacterium]